MNKKSLLEDVCACQSIRQRAVPLPHSCTPAQPHALHITASPSSPCCHRSPRKATFQQPLAEPSALISGLGRRLATRDAAGLTSGLIFYYFLFFFPFPQAHVIFFYALQSRGLFGFCCFLLFFFKTESSDSSICAKPSRKSPVGTEGLKWPCSSNIPLPSLCSRQQATLWLLSLAASQQKI